MNNEPTIVLNQNDLIFLHSPLNMLALFALFLQERFTYPTLPWQFSTDEGTTGIHIHTSYNDPQEAANAYPRIVVGRGSFVHRHKFVQGDLGSEQPSLLSHSIYQHWSMARADLNIQCISQNRGEACILGDIVQSAVGMSRREICKQFKLHELGDIVLMGVQPYERDQDAWAVNVQFQIMFPHRWIQFPTAPALRELTVGKSVYSQSQLNALEYVKRFVLRSEELPGPSDS